MRSPIPRHWLAAGAAALVVAGAGAVVVLAWYTRQRVESFFTDADTIHEPAAAVTPRDVLWRPPLRLTSPVNTPGDEFAPAAGPDGIELYFSRGTPGRNADLWFCRRTPAGWSEPQPVAALNSEGDEIDPHPAADGRRLFFASDRPGGLGGYDLWVARRTGSGWAAPENLGPEINSRHAEVGPAPAPGGAVLYFASDRPRDGADDGPAGGGAADHDLFVARLDASGPAARRLDAVNGPFQETAPAVSPVGDFLYFASDRAGGAGGFDLYRCRRLDDGGAYTLPRSLGETVNTAGNELDPVLSLDGFGLHYASDADDGTGGEGHYDLLYTSSREVFSQARTERRALSWTDALRRLLPALLVLLGVIALLLLLIALAGRLEYRRLTLLAKCLLASAIVHLLLMIAFAFWEVQTALSHTPGRDGGVRVALTSPSVGRGVAAQIRGALTSVDVQAPMPSASPAPPAVSSAAATPALRAAGAERARISATSPSPARAAQRDAPAPAVAAPRSVAEAPDDLPAAPAVAVPATGRRTAEAEPAAAAPAPRGSDAPAAGVTARRRDGAAPVVAGAAPASVPSGSTARSATDRGRVSAPRPAPALAPRAALPPPQTIVPAGPPPAPADAGVEAADGIAGGAGRVAGAAPLRAPAPPAAGGAATVQGDLPRRTARIEGPGATSSAAPGARDAPASAVAAGGVGGAAAPDPLRLDVALPAARRGTGAEQRRRDVVAAPRPQRAGPPAATGGRSRRPVPVTADAAAVRDLRSDAAPRSNPAGAAAASTPAPGRGEAGGLAPLALELAVPRGDPYAQRAPRRREEILQRMGGNPETERAVALALRWLARHQSDDGGWDGARYDDGCGACSGAQRVKCDVALTGLSLLCFLAAGHTHVEPGEYREVVERGLAWLLARQSEDGSLLADESMYSHGIATIALAEACGMTGQPELEDAVASACRFIYNARNRSLGGWRYRPGQLGDTSVLGWQVMALTSARRAAVDVPDAAFEVAERWLGIVEAPGRPGRYAYQPRRAVTPAMTAEGMFVRQLLGADRDEARMGASAEYLLRHPPRWRPDANTYYWYYATLALFQHQGEAWQRWNEAIKSVLLEHQRTEGRAAGSWDPDGRWAGVGGRVYQTAMAALTLEVYYRYLPLYARDPDAARR